MAERYLVIDGVQYLLPEGTDAESQLALLQGAVNDGTVVQLQVQQERTPLTLHVNGRAVGTFLLLPEGTKPSSVQ